MYRIVLSLTCKIFIILLVGFVAARRGVIDGKMNKTLSSFLMEIVLPFSILSSSQQEFSTQNFQGMVQSLLIASVYYIIAIGVCLIITKRMKLPDSKKRIFITLVVFPNIGFIGFSVMNEILGELGILYTIVHNSVYQLFFFSYGIYLLRGEGKFSIRALFGNRIIWISVSSIILYLLPFRFPKVFVEPFNTIGSMMMPISILIIGAQIGKMKFSEITKDRDAYIIDLLRMIIFPTAIFLIIKLLKISHDVAVTVFILSTLPSGSMNVVMAQEYEREPEFATAVIAQNMILMIILLPVAILLLQYI